MVIKQVKETRHYLIHNAEKRTTIRKGDKRVAEIRLCSICHEPLSVMERVKGEVSAIRDHYSCKLNDLVTVYICKDSRVCHKNVGRKENG